MESLFDEEGGRAGTEGRGADGQPLAARARPERLTDFVGQSHLLGEGSALRTAIERGRAHSMILYGPPGTGKTTLARLIARGSGAVFEELSAVQAGRAEVREVLARAEHRRSISGPETVFFLDEIHRFNKAQQDALLPAVEEGLVTLIGATTENPAFEVNGALLSRMRVYALEPLTSEELVRVLRRALGEDFRKGGPRARAASLTRESPQRKPRPHAGPAFASNNPSGPADAPEPELEVDVDVEVEVEVDEEAIEFLAGRSEGDARTALNALELAIETSLERPREGVGATVDIHRMEDALQRRAILYDRGGDRHYDYISAWIKATRGSDPDASLYYLAVMLEGGEDPRFIARRMVILASEDIGNADPGALSLAVAAAGAVEHVGMPEAHYTLAQAAVYLALAPKSNAAGRALWAAREHVREHGAAPVPGWLRSGPRPGQMPAHPPEGYDNPRAHAGTGGHPGHLSPQELMPAGMAGTGFYRPDEAEGELRARLEQIRRGREREGRGRDGTDRER